MRQFLVIVALLVGLTVVGTVGLKAVTGAEWFDCLYMAVITLTTTARAATRIMSRTKRAP